MYMYHTPCLHTLFWLILRCKCDNCGIDLLSNTYECFCCCELEGCEEAIKSEEVLEELKAEGILEVKCITQHPGFSQVCLQKWSLKLAADKYKTKSRARYCQEGTENRLVQCCHPPTNGT